MLGKRISTWLGIMVWIVYIWGQISLAVRAEITDNPYVSLSPDGTAFTIQAGVKDTEWYEIGTQIETGVRTGLPALQKGEHLYEYKREGLIPVGNWYVSHKYARCIHKRYPAENTYHGVSFGRKICGESYFSGWMPRCATCNDNIVNLLFYMSDEVAGTMRYIDTTKAYYYKCPHCSNLEQGAELKVHICKDISKNRYFVRYDANQGNGHMARSLHMYDNAGLYEGREVTPQTTLSLNSYTRPGYIFVGWNTEADGSGTSFEEGETIYNLTDDENAEVLLYAQWKVCRSVLEIDPAGGVYQGQTDIVAVEGGYEEIYLISMEQLIPPTGYLVEFDTGGENELSPLLSERKWKEWKKEGNFNGNLQGNTYTFSEEDASADRITAVYRDCPIILPVAKREGYSFGGWYLDKECTKRIGTAGDEFTPGKSTVLYAGWVELQLDSKENYMANGGKGAIDLAWTQKDYTNKLYAIYQKKEEEEWEQIYATRRENAYYEAEAELLFSGEEETYTVPYTGIYQLSLYGAQGGNYGAYEGGAGGSVKAEVFLEKGDKLYCNIGGQNGYGGGGASEKYAVGGGASTVHSEKYGLLLVAGGGGGASEYMAGYPGGTAGNVMEKATGENGDGGGGGGFYGGKAGKLLFHYHDSVCRHVHTGTPDRMGGCYILPVECGGIEFDKHEVRRVLYYGNVEYIGGEWTHVFCARCGSYECPGHLNIYYGYSCKDCGKEYDTLPGKCTEICSYATECKDWSGCAYEEGELVEVKGAYGGTNYINKEYCMNFSEKAGIGEGDGFLEITAQIIGILEENKAGGVEATDYAPPEAVVQESVSITGLSESKVRVAFQKPRDKGTTYYHMVKSYDVKTNELLCESNTTQNVIATGVVGYYYLVDESAETLVGKEHSYYAETSDTPFLMVEITDKVQYLHLVPVDRAGNLGAATHIKIDGEQITYWPVITEKIVIEQGENVKNTLEENTYFVKADGVTPFFTECEGSVCGKAGSRYQITHISICSKVINGSTEGIFTVITPMQSSLQEGVTTYPMHLLQKKVQGLGGLTDGGYTMTKRYHYGKNLLWRQNFVLPKETDGRKIQLIPQAAVQTADGFVYSEEATDIANCIFVIADGLGPHIRGVEQLEEMQKQNLSGEEKVWIHLFAEDTGSGLAQFYVEIYNTDNGATARYDDSLLNGEIAFEVAPDDMIYNGEFRIMVYAKDAVGNETVKGISLQGIGLQAHVERVLEPHEGPFKRGESGILYIQTIGYVERVEVLFPEELVMEGEPNQFVYSYDIPEYLQKEKIPFVIGLTAADGIKTIQVKAYKKGTELHEQPRFITIEVEGSILDELRTRLR